MPSPELNNLLAHDSANKPASGVFWLKTHATIGELKKLAHAKKLAFFHLEGQKIEKKEQFLNHAAVAMSFPDDAGKNWDAFYDCITDMEWLEDDKHNAGYTIYFDHTDAFAAHHESQLETVIELFQDAVDYWQSEGKTMVVLLSGDHAPAGMKKI